MIMKLKSMVGPTVLVVGTALGTILPEVADAANRCSVAVIGNRTDRVVSFAYQWGDGNWESASVPPGGRFWTWWNYAYPDENRSPRLRVRFDSTFGSPDFWITRTIDKVAVPDPYCREEPTHVFDCDSPRRYTFDVFRWR